MNIYLVIHYGDGVLGAFSTKEKANEYFVSISEESRGEDYIYPAVDLYIHEVVLDA